MKVSVIAKTTVLSVFVIAAVYFSQDHIYGCLCSGFLIYVAVKEMSFSEKAGTSLRFLTELDRFCQKLKHGFFRTGSVRDAVFAGTDGIRQPLRKELIQMLEILESADMRTLGSVYQNSGKNKYLRLLMSMFMLVEENGDRVAEDGSVFMNAVMQLRTQIRDERRYIGSRRHKFMGLTLTAALPCASVMFIAAWGVSTNPNLLTFYYGRAGTVFRIVILAVSLICYRIVARLRDPEISEDKEFRIAVKGRSIDLVGKFKTSFIRVMLFSLSGVVMLISLLMAHRETAELLKTDTGNVIMLCDVADGRQIAAMEYLIPLYTQRYAKSYEECPALDELTGLLLEENGVRTQEVARITAEEIIRRLDAIRKEKADLFDIMIVIASGLAGAMYPGLLKLFDRIMRESRIKEEIMQFQTIISMQKDVPGIGPVEIMESLESFSSYFRPSIKKCLNDYCINEKEALTGLKMYCDDPDIIRIADCFMMADEIGVRDAFDEIASELRAFREDQRAEKNIRMDNDVLLGSLSAVIPGGLILFGYLLIPFMVSALNMFNSYQNSLKDYISIT